jgi:predicted acetylornithine/succinylornithine family transaminase
MTTSAAIAEQYKQFIIPTYRPPSLTLVKGKGTRVWDAEGKVYLDFIAGIAVQNVGHCHPRVTEAIQAQAAQFVHGSNLYYIENQALLAGKLSSLALHGKCFFCNSGAEANEALIKLARRWGSDQGRYEVVSLHNSFHGRTLASLAATGQTKYQDGFEPMPDGFLYAEINNLDSVAKAISDRTAAVLVEAVQGEGGVIPATPEFLKGLRQVCEKKGVLLFCDEVQCGMGRTGKWFAFQHSGVQPDAFSLAKALGSGYPIGAIVTSPKVADVFQPGTHASTFGGSPLACAAALATIAVMEDENLVERAATVGDAFRTELLSFVDEYEHVKEIRGRGLMLGMVLDQPAKPLADMLQENGLLVLTTAENVLRFLPPLNVKETELEEALEILDDALAQWHGLEPLEEAEDIREEEEPTGGTTPAAVEPAEAGEEARPEEEPQPVQAQERPASDA